MAGFLLTLTIVTDIVLIAIAVQSVRLMERIRTRFARLQASMVILLCVTGVIASVQDIGTQATELGWLDEDTGIEFITRIQAVLVVGGLTVLVPVLFILRQLTVEFARSEALTDTLVDRLPVGVSLETAGLTRRETEVVAAVGAGRLSDREIADNLVIAPSTAATHVRNIMKKTGIKRRSDLALLALELDEEMT